MIPTGLKIELPHHLEAQIRPRSGLSAKHGLIVLNTPGTIDPDYRGEIVVILANLGDQTFVVQPGDRIAQMVISPFVQVDLVEVPELGSSVRGEAGFGSTGVAHPIQ